jgi:hypothetical protein
LRDRNYFKRAANTTNAIVIEAAFGRLTGAPVLQIAYPVRDGSQQLEFVLLASLDLTKFMQEQTEHLLHGFEVILTDHKGTVLFRRRRGTGQTGRAPLSLALICSALLRTATERRSW